MECKIYRADNRLTWQKAFGSAVARPKVESAVSVDCGRRCSCLELDLKIPRGVQTGAKLSVFIAENYLLNWRKMETNVN